MSENRFIEKFQHKTDSELEYILENKKSYNEQAVAASIHILKERNGNTPELESVESEIKIEKEKKEITREKTIEEHKKKNNITDVPNAPELHSKKVIMVFSGLFSTIFGAVLLMYNMKQTENQTGRIQVLIFGILYTIITLVVVNSLKIGGNIALIFNIAGGGILTEYFWNKFIGKELQHRKRSWIKPAIISVLITIPLILAAIYGQ
ncbi:conserved membrane hypothetical protein [Tenacibaculum litopenaei]|uniref:hypothetical protein n=1 Tax=Tenacibaculum litopenaei TaxID=396016 RepID=UPI003896576A